MDPDADPTPDGSPPRSCDRFPDVTDPGAGSTTADAGPTTAGPAHCSLAFHVAIQLDAGQAFVERMYTTDGTPEGTHLIDVVSGATTVTEHAGKLIVQTAPTPAQPYFGLWRLESPSGPAEPLTTGTVPFIEMHDVVHTASRFLLTTWDDDGERTQFYASDGTVAGTSGPHHLPGFHSQVAVLGEMVYTFTYPSDTSELWRTDGTPSGTTHLGPALALGNLAVLGNHLYEARPGYADGGVRFRLHRIDNAHSTFEPVVDLPAVQDAGDTGMLVRGGDKLYFSLMTVDRGRTLWVTDGTQAGTRLLAPIDHGDHGYGVMVGHPGGLYFIVCGALWHTDGTVAGTRLVSDAFPMEELLAVSENGRVFGTSSATFPPPLVVSDGTAAGTRQLSIPRYDRTGFHAVAGARFYFKGVVNDLTGAMKDRYAFWASDGTDAGTVKIMDLAWIEKPRGLVPLACP